MNWIFDVFRHSPELSIFLTLALGFALAKVKIKSFSLGAVTSVLLMGILVGQLGISIPPLVKSTFFLLFLFAVGYSVGPQFVHSLKKEGIPQIIFAVLVCTCCLLTAWVCALIAGFDIGSTVGLLSGANTISAVIGVATDTINQLPIEEAVKKHYLDGIPVAYAVTYIFGTAGTAWFLSSIGPKLLGKNIDQQIRDYEKKLGNFGDDDPSLEKAYDGTAFRVIELNNNYFAEVKTVQVLEDYLAKDEWPIYVERIRKANGDIVQDILPDTLVTNGDRLVFSGPLETVLAEENILGKEVADIELLDFKYEKLKVIVHNKAVTNFTLGELKKVKERHGVVINNIKRGPQQIPLMNNIKLQRGDIVEIDGRKSDVDIFAKYLGYAERPTVVTDVLYVGLGIVLGGLLGAITIQAGNIPISLSVSGGVLIMGIIFGWLRSIRPTFGAVPESSVWLMNNLGLTIFIAVVGINAGPDFINGLKTSGLNLFIAGIFVSLVPMIVGLMLGRFVFKFNPAITLGACAGSRTTTAALGAIEENIKSKVPSLAYTTTYAIGNTVLIIWGVVIVILMS